MGLAFTILRAAHASGTHHKLAVDALKDLSGAAAPAWRDAFLQHIELLVEGAKAPDKEFKDFKNHVLHPGDDYWGGAPEKARNWYVHLVTALKESNWSEAAWCAGILSHYYTDPVMPFHTAQSEAESAIHRAVEWSISKSYDTLVRDAKARAVVAAPSPSDGPHWLAEYVCLGAETSHAHYERLIAHYDFKTGAVEPEKGLDPVAARLVGDLLVFARTGFARLLDRAIAEAGAEPPRSALTGKAALATLKIPLRWVLNRIENAEERRLVQAMYDELMRTGGVEENLPEDDRQIRDLHRREVQIPREKVRLAERAKRLASGKERLARDSLLGIGERLGTRTRTTGGPEAAASPAEKSAPARDRLIASKEELSALATATPSVANPTEVYSARSAASAPARYFLTPGDRVADGPSVGTKTAERLAGLGILTVGDLLAADAAAISAGLADTRMTAPVVERWQDEARLMITIPELRAWQAQLLVGAGYRFTEDIAEAKPEELSAALLAFASTQSGQRLLREGAPPDLERIKTWIDAAHAIARAA